MDAAPAATFGVHDFRAKWRGAALKERSASQSHVNDLCRALGVPSPTEADPTGTFGFLPPWARPATMTA